MLDVINLALPFFGLIFLGLVCGKLKQIPETGLAWMNFFLIYVSLPCLFYRVLAQTPLEQLNNPPFIVATMLATGHAVRARLRRSAGCSGGNMARGDDRRPVGRLRQYRLHGAGARARDARAGRERAGRADLLLRHAVAVRAGAVPDDARRPAPRKHRGDRVRSGQAHRAASRSSSRPCSASHRRRSISSRRSRSTG